MPVLTRVGHTPTAPRFYGFTTSSTLSSDRSLFASLPSREGGPDKGEPKGPYSTYVPQSDGKNWVRRPGYGRPPSWLERRKAEAEAGDGVQGYFYGFRSPSPQRARTPSPALRSGPRLPAHQRAKGINPPVSSTSQMSSPREATIRSPSFAISPFTGTRTRHLSPARTAVSVITPVRATVPHIAARAGVPWAVTTSSFDQHLMAASPKLARSQSPTQRVPLYAGTRHAIPLVVSPPPLGDATVHDPHVFREALWRQSLRADPEEDEF